MMQATAPLPRRGSEASWEDVDEAEPLIYQGMKENSSGMSLFNEDEVVMVSPRVSHVSIVSLVPSNLFRRDSTDSVESALPTRPFTPMSPQVSTPAIVGPIVSHSIASMSLTPSASLVREESSVLSPVEKTLLEKLVNLSSELEINTKVEHALRERNQFLEQRVTEVFHQQKLLDRTTKEDEKPLEEVDASLLLRLGMKAFGVMIVLTILQKRLFVSGLVGILGVALAGGVYSFLEDRREHSPENKL